MSPHTQIRLSQNENQRGSILVLVAVSLTMMLLMLAFALDYGWMILARSELQVAADAAALAGAAQLADEDMLFGWSYPDDDIVDARDSAEQFAGLNTAANVNLSLDRNDANLVEGGVVVGYIDNPFDIASPLMSENISEYNSVRVVTELTQELNGPLGLFLGGATGVDELSIAVQSTATLDDRVVGFGVYANQHLNILPFSLNVEIWDNVFSVAYQSEPSPSVFSSPMGPVIGSMGLNVLLNWLSAPAVVAAPSVKMYPNDPEAPGNFGTIDIGENGNSTDVIIDQILYGPTAEEIAYIGGLTLTDEDGDGIFTKWFNGDTGVSTSIKSAIEQIYEEPRILPLHRQVIGTGNTAEYEVCRYVGVKVIDMKMVGALEWRYIEVQPIQVVSREAVIDPSAGHSRFLYALSLTR